MNKTLIGKRKTAAFINLNNIENNLTYIKQVVGNRKICAIVKADSYGHGAVSVSKHLLNSGLIDYFGVATVEEGIELRNAGINTPILFLGITFHDQFELSVKNNLTITVSSVNDITELNNIAGKLKIKAKAHLILDTGMGRIGIQAKHDDYEKIANEFIKSENIIFEGIFSHFSDSSNKEYSAKQIKKYKAATNYFEKTIGKKLLKHMANSGAILNLPEAHFDMVRPGIILYGYKPYDNYHKAEFFKPSMTLRSEISFIKYVKKGTIISYGADIKAEEDCYIATLPIGYADGISRSLSGKMKVLINHKFYRQIGKITMDQIMINLEQDSYKQGTEVLIFDNNLYTANDYADLMGTIPYEVTCNISKRVKRYYIN